MADFCKLCSIEVFGEDYGDLAGLSTEEHDKANLFCTAICEHCGVIQVNSKGECVSECMENHGGPSS